MHNLLWRVTFDIFELGNGHEQFTIASSEEAAQDIVVNNVLRTWEAGTLKDSDIQVTSVDSIYLVLLGDLE